MVLIIAATVPAEFEIPVLYIYIENIIKPAYQFLRNNQTSTDSLFKQITKVKARVP